MKRFNVVDFDCEKRKEIYRLQRRCIHLKENILGFDFRYPDIFSKLICCDKMCSIKVYTNILNLIEIHP